MKVIIRPLLFSLFVLPIFVIGLSSCTKTNTVTKTVTDTFTVVQKDTVAIQDTVITAAILTANSWKVQELRGVIGNTPVYYQRGGSGNTQSLDNEYITFNSNNTGTYTDNTLTQYSITWSFTDATTIVWIWNLPTPLTVTWENVFYKDGAIRYTEHFTQSGQNEVSDGIRIPK